MNEPLEPATLAVIIVTALISCNGFRDPDFVGRLIFYPRYILRDKQVYRLVTSGFLHADWFHLIFNMYSFCAFGKDIEAFYGPGILLAIYFSAIIGGDLLSLYLHRNHEYRALGASGGVCGVIFASIFLLGADVQPLFIPITIPSWLYAIIFLLGSFYGIKRARDNIGHDAHLGGAIIGLLMATALEPRIILQSRPWLFAVVMGISLILLVYLIKNPLLLPLSSFRRQEPFAFSRQAPRKQPPSPPAGHDPARVDAVLEKVSKSGMDSLTDEEHAVLLEASRRKRREEDLRR